jgi:integrase
MQAFSSVVISSRLAAQVGVPRLGWHTFRHTFRSWLDAVGTAVSVRHADVATTMNIYGKAMMDSKLEAHSKLLQYAGVGMCGVSGQPTAQSNC